MTKSHALQVMMKNLSDVEEAQVLEAVSELLLKSRLYEWMKEALQWDYDSRELCFFNCGEVEVTWLAEEAIRESELVPEDQQLDALEDEYHPAWDTAVDAANWWENDRE